MKKVIALVIATVLLLSLLSGCGVNGSDDTGASPSPSLSPSANGSPSSSLSPTANVPALNAVNGALNPNNPITITFYSYSLAQATMRPGMLHLVESFNETIGKEKGVIVEAVEDSGRHQADIIAGEKVSIIQLLFPLLDTERQGFNINPYEEIFPASELSEHLDHLYKNTIELGRIDGQIYALAFTFSTPILFINGTLFEKAGLDPNSPPKTWDEVAAAAKQITEKTGASGFALGPDNGWTSEGILFSNGANILNETKTEAVFASDEGIAAMQMWQDLYRSGDHARGTNAEVQDQFRAGSVGMLITSSALLSGFKSSAEAGGWTLYGAEMPGFSGKPATPVNSGSALAVRSSSPQESAAIWEFIKYVTGPEGYTIITSEIGYLPLNKDIVDDPAYLKGFIDENPIIRTNLSQLERLRPVTIWPAENAAELRQAMIDIVVKAVTTDRSVRDILTEGQAQINSLLK